MSIATGESVTASHNTVAKLVCSKIAPIMCTTLHDGIHEFMNSLAAGAALVNTGKRCRFAFNAETGAFKRTVGLRRGAKVWDVVTLNLID